MDIFYRGDSTEKIFTVFTGAFLLLSGFTKTAIAFINTFSPEAFWEFAPVSIGGCEILWKHKTEQ